MVDVDRFLDFFSMASKNLFKRRLRSWLTMIGIFIGIAAVVALLSLGEGLEAAIEIEFESLGMDKVIISPAGSIFGAGGVDALSDDDVDLLQDVRGVDAVISYMFSTAQIEWGDELRWRSVFGLPTDDDQQELLDDLYTLEKGRWFEEGEKNKAVVGYDYATYTGFEDNLFIGDKFTINGEEFEVVGSLEKIGNSEDDRAIILPMKRARTLLDVPTRLDNIMLSVEAGENIDTLVERIERTMRKDRGLKEGEEDFAVQSFQELLEGFLKILDIVKVVLAGIAGVSLLIGAIGIMNTMYTSVLERTKEIGIMKAIGARNDDVLLLFLIESGLLGLAGGVIGILLGGSLSLGISYLARTLGNFEYLRSSFPLWLLLGSLAFSFTVGVLSGILPARQASRKNPVDSLRYE